MKLLLTGNIRQGKELKDFLASENVSVDIAASISKASGLADLYEYDAVIIATDGLETEAFNWISELAEKNSNEGLLILSSSGSLEIKLKAFDLGVDDFLTIPYHFSELLARIKAVVRRKKFDSGRKIHYGNMMIDLPGHKVIVWNNQLSLTRKEFDILLHLIGNKNKVVSKSALAEYLWGEEEDNLTSYNILIAHIKNLRKKLLQAKAGVEIRNSYAVGYQIIET